MTSKNYIRKRGTTISIKRRYKVDINQQEPKTILNSHSNWPIAITLTKLETLEGAQYPQEEKYPSTKTFRIGFMFPYSYPKVGEPFKIMQSKLYFSFITSPVTKVEDDGTDIIIYTENSKYKIEIEQTWSF